MGCFYSWEYIHKLSLGTSMFGCLLVVIRTKKTRRLRTFAFLIGSVFISGLVRFHVGIATQQSLIVGFVISVVETCFLTK